MIPSRRDRFFSSLRQLEQRLASESPSIKKHRPAEYKELTEAPERVPLDVDTTAYGGATGAGNDFRSAEGNVTCKCGAEDHVEASMEGALTGTNAVHRPTSSDVQVTLNCAFMNALVDPIHDAIDVQTEKSSSTLVTALSVRDISCQEHVVQIEELMNLERAEGQESQAPCVGMEDVSRKCLEELMKVEHRDMENAADLTKCLPYKAMGTDAKAVYLRSDTVMRGWGEQDDAIAGYSAHGREQSDSVVLNEDEEQMYESIFSGENEDSDSLLELSARWTPWEVGGQTCESDSHPPADFLSTPMTNSAVDMAGAKTSESVVESIFHGHQEQDADALLDLTHLCALLGLDGRAWLGEGDAAGPILHESKHRLDRLDRDVGAVGHHEDRASRFYTSVARVGENYSEYAEALDIWLHRLWQLQREPYCHALLLMAKASFQKDRDVTEGFACEFPSIVREWLTLQMTRS